MRLGKLLAIFEGMDSTSGWVVAIAKPYATEVAIASLKEHEFECYAPRYRFKKIVRKKRVSKIAFLFAPYLFVRVSDVWESVLGLRGIQSILLDEEKPARIPRGWVSAMKAKEVGGFIELPKKFEVGQEVEVKAGIFKGRSGIFQGTNKRDRDLIMFETLGLTELSFGDL